jgi:chromosome segregation ATPase
MSGQDAESLTITILKEIRDEIRKTNERVEQTNQRLDQTNQRLDQTNQKLAGLERRQTESEVRLATEIIGVAAAVRDLSDLLRADRTLRAKVDEHDQRIHALERKVG